jgi:polyferredoxin
MNNENTWNISFKTMKSPLILFSVFLAFGLWTGLTRDIRYLYTFLYLGGGIAIGGFLGDALPRKHRTWGRRITQIFVASFLLGFMGFTYKENMQIEGFFFYLLMGIFAGATMHYFLAKVVGTVVLNRGWCGWACWTAMVLDLLPWRKPQNGRLRGWGALRYVHFGLSLGIVLLIWFGLGWRDLFGKTMTELYWMLVGNTLYFIAGIGLAAALKDNRAFCKYLCPIPVLQKIGARFAIWRMKIDAEKCNNCGICERNCPMDIKLLEYKNAGQRILSTECVFCQTCLTTCPKSAVVQSFGQFDVTRQEHLRYRGEGFTRAARKPSVATD